MTTLSRFVSLPLLLSATACGGVASTEPAGRDDEGASAATCSPGEERSCVPPPDCSESHQECVPSGDGWGSCLCDVISGAGGSLSSWEPGFIRSGGRATEGGWDGYVFTAAESQSDISPSEVLDSRACVAGTLAAGYEQWAMIGWNIAQDIDPETLEGLATNAIPPGGIGVRVLVLNNMGSGLRVVLQGDPLGTESWCAPIPPAGGLIRWSDFRKECWTTGGETYDGLTPIAVVGVLTYGESDTLPTAFDFCLLHLGPAW